jgi:hypothetical protein
MRLSDMFPNKYLKAADLQGKDVSARIREAKEEEVGSAKDRKMVLYFHGTDKGLIVNKTNAMAIGDHYGDDTDGWAGRPIVLFSIWTDFQGKATQAIRVRVPTQAQPATVKFAAPPPAEDLDDQIPF